MNPSFVLVLKSERCIDVCKQNRQLSFLVKCENKIANSKVKTSEARGLQHRKRGTPVHKIKITNNTTDENNRFHFNLTINYDTIID